MQKTDIPTAEAIETTDEALVVVVAGRRLAIPWADCSPVLAAAAPDQRRRAELSPGGYGVHWPLLDEDLSIPGLLRDHAG